LRPAWPIAGTVFNLIPLFEEKALRKKKKKKEKKKHQKKKKQKKKKEIACFYFTCK